MRLRGTADHINPARRQGLINERKQTLEDIVSAICGDGKYGPNYALVEHISWDGNGESRCVSYCPRCILEMRLRRHIAPLINMGEPR